MTAIVTRRRVLASAVAAAGAPLIGRARAAAGSIKIALAGPMTGGDAAMGLNAQRGADMATASINKAGGIGGQPVSFTIFDDQGTPMQAASVAQRIIDSGDFAAVVGHVNSSCTLAAMPIYSEAKMPVLCGSSSNPAVTDSGWTNIVRMTIRDDYGAQQYSAFAINNLKKTRPGILFANDDYGRGLRDEMVKAIKVLNATLAAEAGFTPNTDKDFASVITDFHAKGVDVFMLNCNYTEAGLFLGQAKSQGITSIPTVGPDSLLYDSFITLSQGAAEGAYVLAAYDPYATAPATQNFMTAFNTAYSALPSEVAVFTYDFFHLLAARMAAGATQASLIASIKAAAFEGAGGHYAWNAKGDVTGRTFAVIQVKGGKFTSTGLSVDETGLEKLRH